MLPVLGACQSPPAPHPTVISHWMPYGSLYNVLHEGTSECGRWQRGRGLSPPSLLPHVFGGAGTPQLQQRAGLGLSPGCHPHTLLRPRAEPAGATPPAGGITPHVGPSPSCRPLTLTSPPCPCPADFVVDQMQAVKFAFDIARGMAFLHTLEPLIPRHHLNSRSVMVSAAPRRVPRPGRAGSRTPLSADRRGHDGPDQHGRREVLLPVPGQDVRARLGGARR